MRRLIGIGLAVLTAALSVAALASGEKIQEGNVVVEFSGGFAPHSLPRERTVPVTISIEGRVYTDDGSHPPPLRRIELALNRNGRISSAGLPRCRASQLQSTTAKEARFRCGGALVGHGKFAAKLAEAGDPIPSSGEILVFNGGSQRRPELLLHLYGTTPIQATFVLPMKISHRSGELGTVLSAKLPTIAGGVGSVTQLSLVIGREFSYRGQRQGYISASCAAPPGFSTAPFTLARGNFHFADGTNLDPELSRSCRVRG
jgi:hypothetical protein